MQQCKILLLLLYFLLEQIKAYNFDIGATTCMHCLPGTYVANSSDYSGGMCMGCPPGTYTNVQDATACTPCGIGTYNSYFGASSCVPCKNCSTFEGDQISVPCNSTDDAVCKLKQEPCLAGYFRNTTSNLCSVCPVKKYCVNEMAYDLPMGSLNALNNTRGLSDFACKRGYFKLKNKFCCNYNTKPIETNPWQCSECRPGFSYSQARQECR